MNATKRSTLNHVANITRLAERVVGRDKGIINRAKRRIKVGRVSRETEGISRVRGRRGNSEVAASAYIIR